jgi:hypothetical protein
VRPGQEAGTYTLPLPLDLLTEGHVTVRLLVSQTGRAPRVPTADEVKVVRLKLVVVAR